MKEYIEIAKSKNYNNIIEYIINKEDKESLHLLYQGIFSDFKQKIMVKFGQEIVLVQKLTS